MSRVFSRPLALLLLVLAGGCSSLTASEKDAGISGSIRQAAIEAQQKQNYSSAAAYYHNLHQKNPEDLDVLLELARSLRYAGDAAQASKILEAKWESFAGKSSYLLELSKAKLAMGRASDAIEYQKIAVQKDPRNWEAYSAMGISYDILQQYEKAMEAYKIANELSPNNPVVLNNMAISSAQTGQIEMAINTLEQASKIERKNPQIRQNLALFHGIKGNFGEAEAISKMDLDEASVRDNLAFYYLFHRDKNASVPNKR